MKNIHQNKFPLMVWLLTIFIAAGCNDNDDDGGGPPEDGDGNVYSIVTIGDQDWLGENLKTTSLNDGTPIPEVTDNSEWSEMLSPALSWYENNEAQNKDVYGALYNWYSVETAKLCPEGWHVPTAGEWETLYDHLGDSAASKLKETGNTHWSLQNNDATNSTGFTALPGGYRTPEFGFREIGVYGYWWSSSFQPTDQNRIYGREMNAFSRDGSEVVYGRNFGMSVRCLRD